MHEAQMYTYCRSKSPASTHPLSPKIESHVVRLQMMSNFNIDEIDVIVTALYQADDGLSLQKLFRENSFLLHPPHASQAILVAYVYALLYSQNFDVMFEVIKNSRFDESRFKELQNLWYEGRYRENAIKRGKELGPVEKYRLRRKYPPPASIWDGQETIYSFKEKSRKRLKDYYKMNPYPTLEEKKMISRETDLEIIQISNWFKNRRQRDKPSREHPFTRGSLGLPALYSKSVNVDSITSYNGMSLMQPISLNTRV